MVLAIHEGTSSCWAGRFFVASHLDSWAVSVRKVDCARFVVATDGSSETNHSFQCFAVVVCLFFCSVLFCCCSCFLLVLASVEPIVLMCVLKACCLPAATLGNSWDVWHCVVVHHS